MSNSEAAAAQEHNEMLADEKSGPGEKQLLSEKVGVDPGNKQNDPNQTTNGIIPEMSESVANEDDKKRRGIDNPEASDKSPVAHVPLPAKMPKRARSAYFIFTDANRPEVQKAHPGESVAVHAKILGQLWGKMPADEKKMYQLKATEEKEMFLSQIKALKDAGQFPESVLGGSNNAAKVNELIFPVTRIKKIVKLDPEVKGISKEAMMLITRSAEMFTKQLGEHTLRMAQIQNRRTLNPQDVAEACDTGEQYIFLREDMRDLVHEQLEQRRAENAIKGKGEDSKKTAAGMGMKPLTSFFAPKK